MDISDFEGLTKYKVIIPLLYVFSWITMFAGPSFFPVIYQKYSIIMVIFLLIKIAYVTATIFMINIRSCWLFNRTDDSSEELERYQSSSSVEDEILYAFIIPNYNEQVELLSETLDVLAAHKRAKEQYLIFLAMEAHETGSDLKAQELIKEFSGNFRLIEYTRHEVRENEQKGKASNVSWCAEHMEPIFKKHMINPDSVFLTIIDADSWAPDAYMNIMDDHIKENYEDRFNYIYQAPQIFTRNNMDVPISTRMCDIFHSFAHCSNLFSFFDFTFPLSNYTLSFNLVKRIGFWDTCADAIGEDFHTTQKAYWKTEGAIKTVPIYIPFNQVNIETGKGYWADVKARFWQAERHAQGVSDVAYNFKMLFSQPFKMKNILVWYQVFETFVITATLPWILISMNYQSKILYEYEKPSPELINEATIVYLFNAMSILGTFAYINYEIFKRRATSQIYKLENESIFRILEYIILIVVIMMLISIPTFVIAAFTALFGNREYIVAEKKNTTKNHHHH